MTMIIEPYERYNFFLRVYEKYNKGILYVCYFVPFKYLSYARII